MEWEGLQDARNQWMLALDISVLRGVLARTSCYLELCTYLEFLIYGLSLVSGNFLLDDVHISLDDFKYSLRSVAEPLEEMMVLYRILSRLWLGFFIPS